MHAASLGEPAANGEASIPVTVGDRLTVRVTNVAFGGEGVARHGNFVVFVPFTAPTGTIRLGRLRFVVAGGNLPPGCSRVMQDNFEERTWRAFWQTAVEHQAAADVAQDLGISAAAVYMAKSRVLRRLREELDGLDLID